MCSCVFVVLVVVVVLFVVELLFGNLNCNSNLILQGQPIKQPVLVIPFAKKRVPRTYQGGEHKSYE